MSWLYHADLLGFVVGWLTNVRRIYWNIRCSDMRAVNRSASYRLLMWVLIHLSPFPAGVAVNSEAGKKHHKNQGYHPKAWHLIPNGVNLEQFHPDPNAGTELRVELGIPEHAVLVGQVGRFHPMKDYNMLFDVAASVIKENPDAHFILVGKEVRADNPYFSEKLEQYGVADRVHLLGNRQDIPAILAGLDLLVLSSAFGEGAPNVLIESMGCAVPCVVTDIGDAARIVSDTGWVVQSTDFVAMADAILAYLALPEAKRRVLGQNALSRVREKYSLETAIERYRDLFLGKA